MPGISPWAADMEDITSHSKLGHFVQRLAVLLCGCTVYWASIIKKKTKAVVRGHTSRINQSCRYLGLSGGNILSVTFIIWKNSCHGGPQHDSGGMIGLIAQCCMFSPKETLYVSVRTCGRSRLPLDSVFVYSDHFTTQRKGSKYVYVHISVCGTM